MDSEEKRAGSKVLKVGIGASLVALSLWIGSLVMLQFFGLRWNDAGTFGDSFGAVNALFSGLGLVGILVAIFLQREDLNRQEEEGRRMAKIQQDEIETARLSAILSAHVSLKASEERFDSSYYGGKPPPDRSSVIEDILKELERRVPAAIEIREADNERIKQRNEMLAAGHAKWMAGINKPKKESEGEPNE